MQLVNSQALIIFDGFTKEHKSKVEKNLEFFKKNFKEIVCNKMNENLIDSSPDYKVFELIGDELFKAYHQFNQDSKTIRPSMIPYHNLHTGRHEAIMVDKKQCQSNHYGFYTAVVIDDKTKDYVDSRDALLFSVTKEEFDYVNKKGISMKKFVEEQFNSLIAFNEQPVVLGDFFEQDHISKLQDDIEYIKNNLIDFVPEFQYKENGSFATKGRFVLKKELRVMEDENTTILDQLKIARRQNKEAREHIIENILKKEMENTRKKLNKMTLSELISVDKDI